MKYQFGNLGAGIYTYGVGLLAGMPSSFTQAPHVHVQRNSECEVFLAALPTTTGFEIVDRGTGATPVLTVTIIEIA